MAKNVHTYPLTGAHENPVDVTSTAVVIDNQTAVRPALDAQGTADRAYATFSTDAANGTADLACSVQDLDADAELANVTLTSQENATRTGDFSGSLRADNRVAGRVNVVTAGNGGMQANVSGTLVVQEFE